jgi:ABC-type transport system involved in multi-copper enzyme maturation permease subunit
MNSFCQILQITFFSIIRDRVLYALAGAGLLLFVLVPVISLFSMRQIQELGITLSLSSISLVLLVLATLLGGFSVWRDIERRYTAAVLGLPVSRTEFLLGKFAGISLFLGLCVIVLGLISVVVINLSASFYPSDLPIAWATIALAIVAEGLKYILLTAFALLLSSLSTSFFLPIFGTLAIYFTGNASQEVMEYVSGEFGQQISTPAKLVIQSVYYLVPNFSIFDLKVYAVYALPVSIDSILYMVLYFLIYTAILLFLATRAFSRRELV